MWAAVFLGVGGEQFSCRRGGLASEVDLQYPFRLTIHAVSDEEYIAFSPSLDETNQPESLLEIWVEGEADTCGLARGWEAVVAVGAARGVPFGPCHAVKLVSTLCTMQRAARYRPMARGGARRRAVSLAASLPPRRWKSPDKLSVLVDVLGALVSRLDIEYKPDPLTVARGRHERLCEEVARLRVDIQHRVDESGLGVVAPEIVDVRSDSDLASFQHANDQMADALAVATRDLEDHLVRRRTEAFDAAVSAAQAELKSLGQVRSRVEGVATPEGERVDVVGSSNETGVSNEPETSVARATEKARDAIAALPEGVPDDLEADLSQLISELGLARESRQVDRVVDEIRRRAYKVSKLVEQRAERQALLERVAEVLDQSDSRALTELRRELASMRAGTSEIPSGFEGRCREAVSQAQLQSTLSALATTFAENGYRVTDEFAGLDGGFGSLVDVPSSQDHAVLVRSRDGRLLINLVRIDNDLRADPEIDLSVERRMCDLVPELDSAARAVGMELDMDRHDPDGNIQIIERRPETAARPGRERREVPRTRQQ